MTVLDWLTVVGVGATIFGLIVGLFSTYNGRRTREYIGDLIRAMHAGTKEMHAATREMHVVIREMHADTKALLDRMDQRLQAQHALIERLAGRQDDILGALSARR